MDFSSNIIRLAGHYPIHSDTLQSSSATNTRLPSVRSIMNLFIAVTIPPPSASIGQRAESCG
jgi:hypothetical protein